MKFQLLLLGLLKLVSGNNDCQDPVPFIEKQNNCINFSVGAGTGCAWMCSYCEQQLGTTNYYFTDGVCTYETGGCVGNPQVGVTYTCCSN